MRRVAGLLRACASAEDGRAAVHRATVKADLVLQVQGMTLLAEVEVRPLTIDPAESPFKVWEGGEPLEASLLHRITDANAKSHQRSQEQRDEETIRAVPLRV